MQIIFKKFAIFKKSVIFELSNKLNSIMNYQKMLIENPPVVCHARVYVGSYGKYNAGSLAGEYVDLSQFSNEKDFYDHCRNIHSDEQDPEFMFQDYEHEAFFEGMISEYGLSSNFFQLMQEYLELDDHEKEMVSAFINAVGCDQREALDKAADCFVCCDLDDYAEEIVDSYQLPEIAERYFDYEMLKRDLEIELSYGECNGNSYYFQNY